MLGSETMPDEWILYGLRIAGVLFSIGCVCFIIEMQRRKLKRMKEANMNSSIVMLHKRHAGNMDYASFNQIHRIDGMRTETFLYRVGIPAVYLSPGEHVIEVESSWTRHIRGQRMKNYKAGPKSIHVEVKAGQYWSLEYCISENRFVFEKCDPQHVFKRA